MNWTKEYYNIQHLGKFSLQNTWVTVERHSTWASLIEWFPGCKFNPKETVFPTVEDAKKRGELIIGGNQ